MRMSIPGQARPRSVSGVLSVAAMVPFAAWAAVGGGSASAPSTGLAAVVTPSIVRASPTTDPCTPRHPSGCDGTDDPAPGDGRTLKYCGPDDPCAADPPGDGNNSSARIPTGTAAQARHGHDRH
ncbi:MAG TPA: hypothetical protein VHV82_01985 [Sporichthyaceae bacterium]|jgi:hypothetical protein|nr:hypothetical protein [Sporichthyaceae bacterium]